MFSSDKSVSLVDFYSHEFAEMVAKLQKIAEHDKEKAANLAQELLENLDAQWLFYTKYLVVYCETNSCESSFCEQLRVSKWVPTVKGSLKAPHTVISNTGSGWMCAFLPRKLIRKPLKCQDLVHTLRLRDAPTCKEVLNSLKFCCKSYPTSDITNIEAVYLFLSSYFDTDSGATIFCNLINL